MTSNHLLSTSLFEELFRHNLVSPDGRIIANEQQLQDYYSFLVQQSKDKIARLHEERKNMVTDAQKLLKLEYRTKKENGLLQKLLNELDLEFEDDELILKGPKELQRRYLGPAEPQKNFFERQIEEELRRVRILKRDLRILDDWLEQISRFRPLGVKKCDLFDWNEANKKFRQKTMDRMCDMEKARMKLIKQHFEDYDATLYKVLNPNLRKEQYLTAKFKRKTRYEDEPKEDDATEDEPKDEADSSTVTKVSESQPETSSS